MEAMTRISVALCTYNGSRYLEEQLRSIAQQTRLPDELIICDDRSHDTTVQIVEDFAKKAPFPVYLHINDVNIGVVKNFEKAIKLCMGDLIALADQDDFWFKEKLLLEEEVFHRFPNTGLVFTNAEVVDENLVPLGYDLWSTEGFDVKKQALVREGRAFEVLLKKNFVTGATMMFRREYLSAIIPFPNTSNNMIGNCMIHDYWIALIIAALAEVRFVNSRLVKYRQHSSQLLGASIKGKQRYVRDYNIASYIEDLNRRLNELKRVEKALATQRGKVNSRALSLLMKEQKHIEEKISHLSMREAICDNNFTRKLLLITQELVSLRYHKHSNGLRSAIKDLFRGRH